MSISTKTIEMADFASDGDSMTKTVDVPDDAISIDNVTLDMEACGDLSDGNPDEYFTYYLDGSQEGGQIAEVGQDCTYHSVWSGSR